MGNTAMPARMIREMQHFPLVVYRMHPDGLVDEDVDLMIDTCETIFARRARYATLVYAGGLRAGANAKLRARIAAWELEHKELFQTYHVGAGIVLHSAILRGALTALRWVSPALQPELITGDPVTAATFCLERLEESGVSDLGPVLRYIASLERHAVGT